MNAQHEKELRELREKLSDISMQIDYLAEKFEYEWQGIPNGREYEEQAHETMDIRDTLYDVSSNIAEQYDIIGELLQEYLGEDCLED